MANRSTNYIEKFYRNYSNGNFTGQNKAIAIKFPVQLKFIIKHPTIFFSY